MGHTDRAEEITETDTELVKRIVQALIDKARAGGYSEAREDDEGAGRGVRPVRRWLQVVERRDEEAG